MNLVLRLAYDGGMYLGWQKCAAGPSIEATLQTCLETILNHPVRLQAASRTDAGVHAHEQVVNFFTDTALDLATIQLGLKRLLPKDIYVVSLKQAADHFHPTLDCTKKLYTYTLQTHPLLPFERHYIWHYPYPLDLKRLQKAAQTLVGKRDFKAFETQNSSPATATVREIFAIDVAEIAPQRFQFQIYGDHFLYKMVRTLVGTLVQCSCGKLEHDLQTILDRQERKLAGITAPAHALFLTKVYYRSEHQTL